MKVVVEDQKPCQKVLKIQYPAEKLKSEHQTMLTEFQKQAKIPGFRPGKAPIKTVETKFFDDIKSEVLRKILPEICKEALQAEKVLAVSDPSVDQMEYDLEKGLSFRAVVDIPAKVVLPEYKKIKLEKKSTDVTDEDIQKAIDGLREHHGVFEPVAPRPLQLGDFAIVDYTSLSHEKTPKRDHRKNVLISIQKEGENHLTDQLIGMQPGESKQIVLKAEQEHPEMIFDVKLHEIKQKKLPELDNEFLKTLGEVKTVDELREKVKSDISSYRENASQEALKNEAIKILSEKVDFDVPTSQVNHESEKLYTELVNRVRQGAVSSKSLQDPQVLKDLETEAKRRVKVAYLLYEIAQKEDLKVSDEELSQDLEKAAQKLGKHVEEIRADFEKNNRLEALRARLTQDKVIDFILKSAIIKNQ